MKEKMAKNYRINLRLSAEEYATLKSQAGKTPLARYCRNTVLAEQGGAKPRKAVKNQYSATDPTLLKELNAIGNNLNQVARLGNIARKRNSLELWQLTECLRLIHSDLQAIIEQSQGRGGDAC